MYCINANETIFPTIVNTCVCVWIGGYTSIIICKHCYNMSLGTCKNSCELKNHILSSSATMRVICWRIYYINIISYTASNTHTHSLTRIEVLTRMSAARCTPFAYILLLILPSFSVNPINAKPILLGDHQIVYLWLINERSHACERMCDSFKIPKCKSPNNTLILLWNPTQWFYDEQMLWSVAKLSNKILILRQKTILFDRNVLGFRIFGAVQERKKTTSGTTK